MTRRLASLALAAAATALLTLAFSGCAGTASGSASGSASSDGRLQVVASTDVYGQIAEEIGGNDVEVTSLISSASQDPHAFEASARDQLIVSRADLIVQNGAGYDAFVDALIQSSGAKAPVLTAATFSPAWTGEVEGFNEHVWYDFTTIDAVVGALVDQLSTLRPDDAAAFAANAATFTKHLDALKARLADIATAHQGEKVFVTEPVPLYLAAAAGLDNATPPAFSEAVEEGQDVPPATLLEALALLKDGGIAVLIANAQTGGAETTQVIDEATARSIPVLEFTETLPKGETYLSWMQSNVDALASALAE